MILSLIHISYEVPDEDMINLPKNNGENDYLEFVHREGNDIIIPHLSGDLKISFQIRMDIKLYSIT